MEKDSFYKKGLRKKMVEVLRQNEELDPRVLDVMEELPRHYFVDTAFTEKVYSEGPFPIGSGQTISSPYTVAYQSTLLKVESRQKILEIGTGSGYQAAVLSKLGARVYTLERHEPLFKKASSLLKELELTVRCYHRDGFKGLPEMAPFDGILVTAGATEIPEKLKMQLREGGRLVIPVGIKRTQQMLVVTRLGPDDFRVEKYAHFRFVPFLKGKA
ncbi:MAG: protein-L-isoaspartate(D-aspartate) O-methyltransferase [Saprospiraceae bacterium]|nr:protein-L-isoaspartate(D-aspartate) O-methyltransferase [Saprospiraceae bacterium]